jgi:hypothetical protein
MYVCMYVCMRPKFFQFHVGFHHSCARFVLDLHYGKTKNTKMLGLPCLKGGLTRSQVTGVKPEVRVSQSQVAELKLGSTLPTPNSRKG